MKGFRFVAAFIALALSACGDGSVQSPAFTPQLVDISISPTVASKPVGLTQQFTAAGRFSTAPGTPEASPGVPATTAGEVDDATFTSSDPAVATIDSKSGLATAVAQGTTTITVSANGKSATATLTVTPAELTSVVIVRADDETKTPISADSLARGGTRDYQALGIFTDSTTPRPITGVTWTAAPLNVATATPLVGAQTTVRAVSNGTATITANSGTQNATLTLTVTDAAVTSLLRVEPPFAVVIPGNSIAFQAIGKFTDDSEAAVQDSDLDWTSSVPAAATINAEGDATGVAEGRTVITATLKAGVGDPAPAQRSATAELTVADTACTSPLLNSQGASITATPVGELGLCVLCGIADEGNIIDDLFTTYGQINVPVGLLNGNAYVTVTKGNPGTKFAAGNSPGFILGRPAGTLVLAEVLSQIEISTLNGGAVQETSGPVIPLRLDLLGLQLLGNNQTVLASITNTTLPFDSVRLKLKSGVASALTNVQVYSACSDTTAPDTVPGLTNILRIEPNSGVTAIEQDASAAFQVIGTFADGSEGPVPNSAVTWSITPTSVATVDANGLVKGVAPGPAVITARLNDGVNPDVVQRQLTLGVSVFAKVCTTPLVASGGATVDHQNDGLCLACSVTGDANVIDDATSNFATMTANLAVLGGTSLTVSSPATTSTTAQPFPANQRTGFIIGTPIGQVLSLDLLGGITVSALRNGTVVASTGPSIPLKLDLLGVNLTANSNTGLISVAPTQAYDAIRISLGGVANVLSSVKVFRACSAATPPPAPAP